LALLNHQDSKRTFPPAGSMDEKGDKLLSWRVQILPYIEQQALYDRFHRDEPWDSDHNRQLISKMPAVFCSPGSGLQKKGLSNYLAPVGEKLAFTGGDGIPIKEFTDGTSMTIMVVEVDPLHAVVWTKPDDLAVDLEHPFRGITNDKRQEFMAAFVDGHVAVFDKNSLGAERLRALFTRNGGEPVSP